MSQQRVQLSKTLPLDYAVQKGILSRLDADSVLLTPNRRLAATMMYYFDQHMINESRHFAQTPQILPLTTWFEMQWHQHGLLAKQKNIPYLLSPAQSAYLWRKIITQSHKIEQVIRLSETVNLAISAYQLMKAWCIDINSSEFEHSEDYALFQDWAKEYQTLCQSRHWIDAADIPEILLQLAPTPETTSKQFILYGFTELPPQIQKYFDVNRRYGCSITNIATIQLEAYSQRTFTQSSEDEIHKMAQWSLERYRDHMRLDASAPLRIGCVIPNLEKIRERVHQIFNQTFAELPSTKAYFNISAGRPLIEFPIIQAALTILAMPSSPLPYETVWFLLTTPFIGGAESEHQQRAKLDFQLHKQNLQLINLNTLSHLALFQQYCPKLLALLDASNQYREIIPEKRLFSDWIIIFNDLLKCYQWPGERSVNSEEYQVIHQWMRLLNELAHLDYVASEVTYTHALHTLQTMASMHIFQPQSDAAPIQILGLLEAAGMPLDELWVAGMDDQTWPPQPKPNPFLPRIFQRQLHMPHATAERELRFCQQLLHQFSGNCHRIIYSYARSRSELELQCSPLVAALPEAEDLLGSINKQTVNVDRSMIEILNDTQARAVGSQEIVRGGVTILQAQQACPFKALSEARLHAKPLEPFKPGIDAKNRGIILHKILEIIFKAHSNLKSLQALTQAEETLLIDEAISKAMDSLKWTEKFSQHFLKIEINRLKVLTTQWLSLEKTRPPYRVIATEKAILITINQLAINVKIDRIDELEDGQLLIIDYKTRRNNSTQTWFDDKASDIQLPLYTMIETDEISAITFAQVVANQCQFKGISHNDIGIVGVKPIAAIKNISQNWHTQIKAWHDLFRQLADRFYAGYAAVMPQDGNKTCEYCHLQSLCRIEEARQ